MGCWRLRQMKARWLAWTLLFAAGCTAEPLGEEDELESSSSPIVGGGITSAEPAIGALITFDGKGGVQFCTGFLVAPEIVASAGHCAARAGMPSFYTGTGARMTTPPKSKADLSGFVEHAVKAKLAFPSYRGGTATTLAGSLANAQTTMRSDFAVYRLAQPITNVTPIRFGTQAPKGATCTAIGYGYDAETGTIGALRKRRASVSARTLSGYWIEATRGNGEPAKGDSGSPLLCGGKAVGVCSFFYSATSDPTADLDYYANATGDALTSWIDQTAKAWGVAGLP